MKKIILASASPRRKQLLKKIGLKFKAIPSKIKESINPRLPIEAQIIRLALAKAENVAKRLNSGLIIAADTVVCLDNKIFGKPKNFKQAKHILSTLNNTTHRVLTAIAVIDVKTKNRAVDIDKTIISTRKLTPKQIENFALKNQDKAGAYAVQENTDVWVKKIRGDFYNIVGLPLGKIKSVLAAFGVKTKSF